MAVKRDRYGRIIGGEPVEKAPQKSVQPVAKQATQAAPSAQRMTLDQLLKKNVASGQVLDPLTKQLGISGWEYMPDAVNESGEAIGTGVADRQALLSSPLAGYTFDWQDTGSANTGTLTAYDPTGKRVGAYDQQDQSFGDTLKEYVGMGAGLLAGPLGLGASVGGALGLTGTAANVVGGGLIGGGTAAITGQNIGKGLLMGGLGGAVSSYFGAPSGGEIPAITADPQAAIDAFVSANPVSVADFGLPNIGDAIPAITASPQAAIDAFVAANPVTASDFLAGMPTIQAPSAMLDGLPGITVDPGASIDAYVQSNPVTQQMVNSTLPNLQPPTQPMSQADFRASERADYQTDGRMPSSPAVDKPWTATDYIRDTVANVKQAASPVTGVVNDVQGWMKTNPVLGRLLMAGATGLLTGSGSSGSSGSSGAAQAPSGPPVQWNSGLQQGLLTPVQQYAPPPVVQNRPAGLLAQGFQNDGAWRYLKG